MPTPIKASGHLFDNADSNTLCQLCGMSVREYCDSATPCPKEENTTQAFQSSYQMSEAEKERLWNSIVHAATQ
jgi:hypothetical protein